MGAYCVDPPYYWYGVGSSAMVLAFELCSFNEDGTMAENLGYVSPNYGNFSLVKDGMHYSPSRCYSYDLEGFSGVYYLWDGSTSSPATVCAHLDGCSYARCSVVDRDGLIKFFPCRYGPTRSSNYFDDGWESVDLDDSRSLVDPLPLLCGTRIEEVPWALRGDLPCLVVEAMPACLFCRVVFDWQGEDHRGYGCKVYGKDPDVCSAFTTDPIVTFPVSPLGAAVVEGSSLNYTPYPGSPDVSATNARRIPPAGS
jgi:hypothetical protein